MNFFHVESNNNGKIIQMWEILSCYKIFMQISPDYSFNSCLAINLYNYFVNVITRLYNFYLYFYCSSKNYVQFAKKQYITLNLRQFVEFSHFFYVFKYLSRKKFCYFTLLKFKQYNVIIFFISWQKKTVLPICRIR